MPSRGPIVFVPKSVSFMPVFIPSQRSIDFTVAVMLHLSLSTDSGRGQCICSREDVCCALTECLSPMVKSSYFLLTDLCFT